MARADIHNLKHWLELAHKSAYKAQLLSKELNISTRHLRRCTMQLFGCSPQHWLNEQRLILAERLLKETRLVKIVSSDLGFKQVSHFSREFKLRYGLSPTAFLALSGQDEANNRTNSTEAQKQLSGQLLEMSALDNKCPR
jgi:AraC-like DNA-binding protein